MYGYMQNQQPGSTTALFTHGEEKKILCSFLVLIDSPNLHRMKVLSVLCVRRYSIDDPRKPAAGTTQPLSECKLDDTIFHHQQRAQFIVFQHLCGGGKANERVFLCEKKHCSNTTSATTNQPEQRDGQHLRSKLGFVLHIIIFYLCTTNYYA